MQLKDWTGQALPALLIKESTYYDYASLLSRHVLPRLGHRDLESITTMEVRGWIADLSRELSASRVRSAYYVLKALMDLAVEDRLIDDTPCKRIKLPKVTQTTATVLQPAQVRSLALACGRYADLVLWLAFMGTRWGEAAGLEWDQFKDDTVIIDRALVLVAGRLVPTTPKSHQTRSLTIPQFLQDRLRSLRMASDSRYVFTGTRGTPLRSSNFRSRVWLPACESLGLSLRIHDLRHTCAAMLIGAGAHPKEVQVWMGHSDISTTMNIYGHLFDNTGLRLAEMLDTLSGYRDGAEHG